MIVVQVTDPVIRKAAKRAAHADEDVVVEARDVLMRSTSGSLGWSSRNRVCGSPRSRLPSRCSSSTVRP